MKFEACEVHKAKWERFFFLSLPPSKGLTLPLLPLRCKDIWYYGRFLKGRVDGLEHCEPFFMDYMECMDKIKGTDSSSVDGLSSPAPLSQGQEESKETS